jgi:hypothetical protein
MPNTANYNFDAPGEQGRYMRDLIAERNAPMAGGGLRPEEFRALQSNLGSGLQAPLMAVNPKTGQMERVYVQNGLDENGTGVDKAYFFESDPNKPQDAMAGLAGGYSTDNGGDLFSRLAQIVGATAGFQVGGATGVDIGQNVGSGQSPSNVDLKRDLTLDAAGLAAGAGLSSALPALGLSTAPAAATAEEAFLAGSAAAAPEAATAGITGLPTAAAPGVAGAVTGLPLTAAAGGTALGAGAAAAGAGGGVGATKLGDILSGNVSPGDIASNATLGDLAHILGTGAATIGSIYGNQQIADQYQQLANQYMNLGAPSRARYEATFDPNFDINSLPGLKGAMDTSTQSILRGLSTNGNPFGNPGGLAEAMKYVTGNVALPALQNYRNQNAATGGYGAFSTAAPGAAGNAINATGNSYADLG